MIKFIKEKYKVIKERVIEFKDFLISKIKFIIAGFSLFIITIIALYYFFLHDPDFYIEKIPDKIKNEIISSKKWHENCGGADISRLVLINVKYYSSKNHIERNGKLIMLDAVSDDILNIFKKIYKKKIIINKIKTIDYYDNYNESYLDNNSISFSCDIKNINSYTALNYHFGTGLDINPKFNPKIEILLSDENENNENSSLYMKSIFKYSNYLNRNLKNEHKNEDLISIFAKYGFSDWGGNFNIRDKIIAYNYFGVNDIITSMLVLMNPDDAKVFFKIIKDNYKVINRIDKEEFLLQFRFFYQEHPDKFLIIMKKNLSKLNKMQDAEFFNFLKLKFSEYK